MKVYTSNGSYCEYLLIQKEKPLFLITDSEKSAKESFSNLKAYKDFFKKDLEIIHFPSSQEKLDLLSQIERNYAIYKILAGKNWILVFSKDALNIKVRTKENFLKNVINIKKNGELNREFLIEKLYKLGYIREEFPENEGEFSVRGGFLTINIPKVGIVDIDFFGDTIENIFLKSKILTRKEIEEISILPLYDFNVKSQTPLIFEDEKSVFFKDYLKNDVYTLDIYEDLKLPVKGQFFSKFSNPEVGTIKDITQEFAVYKIPLKKELVLLNEKTAFLPEVEEKLELDVEPLKEGDYIIHEDFGIGIYRGIETREIRGKVYDFMILEYAGGEKVYVSYLHFDKIHKYKTNSIIQIDKIGGTSWRNLKKKVKESLKNIAKNLLEIYSKRQNIYRPPLKTDDELINKFEREFPFVETPDQIKAIKDIKSDFLKPKPMERLICGDVGFGKTEVAIRGIFISVINGCQALLLVPTTVLAYQHYKKLKERLEPYGIIVENLSRLKSKKENDDTIKAFEEGKIDVLVATHKILHTNLSFNKLGLLVIDEEHRFGVKAKEKIRQIRESVDTLYLTATPIPRTLNMALSGLKDISVLTTPPEGRYEIKTYVSNFDEELIKKAIEFEIDRNGQVFYLHNRIETIKEIADFLKNLVKKAKVDFIHGKMKPSEIEKKIIDFLEGKTNVLVSTSIIETGIDIPTANTLIVDRADLFGLAQLYHLRGRVGRGNIQAYCYLIVPKEITKDAKRRIDTLLKLTRPGSGLKVSIEDMQIRGPGNILGIEQSGFIKSLGYYYYVKLLKEAINEERGEKEFEAEMEIDFDYYIPQDFIKDPTERLNIYMAVSKAEDYEEIEKLRKYLKEFYNDLPKAFDLYLVVSEIKKLLSQLKIKKLHMKSDIAYLQLSDQTNPEVILKLIENLNPIKIEKEKIIFQVESLEELKEKILEDVKSQE
jgi:transcription-repair coupling factor (superfamily II helicase)